MPLAIRAQAFVQGREGEEVDFETGPTGNDSSFDIQAPYLIKLLSSAPLSDNISYYFYAIYAEKGGNGEVIVEDAWFSYADIAGSGVNGMLGQFQVSDLMFPREVRLTFQDFFAYRAAGINSPGHKRPDRMFDNDSDKNFFGVDLSGSVGEKTHWFAQLLWNEWDEFLDADPSVDYDWWGGFAGVDYLMNDRWVFSMLYNYTDADDFDGTGTVYEGIDINSLTFAASYYFMRNVDFLSEGVGRSALRGSPEQGELHPGGLRRGVLRTACLART